MLLKKNKTYSQIGKEIRSDKMNIYQEYERRKAKLEGLSEEEYAEAVKKLIEELGI